MSDLTNQINELFDAPKEVEQEPIIEEVVEESRPEVKQEPIRIDMSSLFETVPEPVQEEIVEEVVVEKPKRKEYVYKKLKKPPVKKKTEVFREQAKEVEFNFNKSLNELFEVEKKEVIPVPKREINPLSSGERRSLVNLREELFPSPDSPEKKREKTRHDINMERASAALSMLESKKEPKTVVIKEDKSVSERLALLEQDVFNQMSKGTPNTLVSGIGASLDSGGGAVWLWDLNDVNIGTPSNGTYPVINDNDVLKFDSATNKWIPGAPTVNSADLPLAGGTMTGDIVFNSSQTFPGTLELDGGTMTGDITFNSGQTFPGTLPLTGGTMTGDISFNSGQAFPGTLLLAGGAITGDTTYAGSTAAATNLQTKTSVSALISAAVTGGFVFKGTTDVTGAAPTPAAGDFYINTVAGTASASWTGIANLTISADQLVIYSGSESRWFAGAVENNSSYLLKTGGTMTGTLTIDSTADFVKNRHGDDATKDFLIKGATAAAPTVATGNLLQVYRNTLADASLSDVVSYFGGVSGDNNIQTKASVNALISSSNSSFLQKSGGTMTGTLTTDEIDVPKGKTLTIKRGNSNTSSSGLDIKGYAPNQVGTLTDIFGVSYGNGTTTGDSINYKGRTDGSNNLQTKGSVTTLINAAIASDGNLLNGGEIISSGGISNNSGLLKVKASAGVNASGQIQSADSNDQPNVILNPQGYININGAQYGGSHVYLEGAGAYLSVDNSQSLMFKSSSTVMMTLSATQVNVPTEIFMSGGTPKFSVNNNKTFHFSDQANDFMTLSASSLTLKSPADFTGASFTVERGLGSSSNGTNFYLKGMLPSSIGTTTSTLVSIKRSSGVGDTLQYFGSTTTNDNTVQTKGSVVGSSLYQNKADNVGSTLTGFFLVEYKKGISGIVEVVMHAVDENNIVAGDIICVLPTGYRPAFLSDNTNGYCPVFTLYNNDFTISATCVVKPTGAITVIQVSGNSLTFQGQCVFSTLTPS